MENAAKNNTLKRERKTVDTKSTIKPNKSTKSNNKTKQSRNDADGKEAMVNAAAKNNPTKHGGKTVDTNTAAANFNELLVAQAGAVTETSIEVSSNEVSALKRVLSDAGINIRPDITHPEAIIKRLIEEDGALLVPLRQRLQTLQLICIFVDFYVPTEARKQLKFFLTLIGVNLKIVGTETIRQTDCECGHISSQVITLLAKSNWWSILNDKFVECASKKSIAAVNEFLGRDEDDRKSMNSADVIRYAKSHINPIIDIQTNGYLRWYNDMTFPLIQALITILEDLQECLSINKPFARTIFINMATSVTDPEHPWITLRLASQTNVITDLTTNPNNPEVANNNSLVHC